MIKEVNILEGYSPKRNPDYEIETIVRQKKDELAENLTKASWHLNRAIAVINRFARTLIIDSCVKIDKSAGWSKPPNFVPCLYDIVTPELENELLTGYLNKLFPREKLLEVMQSLEDLSYSLNGAKDTCQVDILSTDHIIKNCPE